MTTTLDLKKLILFVDQEIWQVQQLVYVLRSPWFLVKMGVEKLQSLNVLDMLQRVTVLQDHTMVGKNDPAGFTLGW